MNGSANGNAENGKSVNGFLLVKNGKNGKRKND
jgi:hypothetical protein